MTRNLVRVGIAAAIFCFSAAPSQAQKFLKKDVGGWTADLATPTNETARRNAAFALGKMGKFALDAVPALKRALDADPSPKVRDAAAYALGEIARLEATLADDPQLAPLLMKALKDDSWAVRRSAVFALGCLGKNAIAARPAVEAALSDPNAAVRQNAAWALGRQGADAIPKLREALGDTDPFVRRDATQSLDQFEDPVPLRPALGDVLRLCRDEHSEVRRAAVKLLVRVVGSEDAKVAAGPLQAVLAESDDEIRTNAALALANIGGKEAQAAVPQLISALHRGDIDLRRQAAAALRNIGPDAARAVPDLIKTLNESDKELRTNAALALGGIGAPAERAVPALVALLANLKEAPEPRKAAAVALSRIGRVPSTIDAMPRLLQTLSNAADDGDVRWRIVWALRPHDIHLTKMEGVYASLTKVLKEAKTDENRMLRYDCAYMLGMLQGKDVPGEVLDTLIEFLRDSRVQIYESTQATVQGAGQETAVGKAKVEEIGKGDGRVMATQALTVIGAARVRQRPEIVQQLRALAKDAETFGELRKECQVLLKTLGQ